MGNSPGAATPTAPSCTLAASGASFCCQDLDFTPNPGPSSGGNSATPATPEVCHSPSHRPHPRLPLSSYTLTPETGEGVCPGPQPSTSPALAAEAKSSPCIPWEGVRQTLPPRGTLHPNLPTPPQLAAARKTSRTNLACIKAAGGFLFF